MNPDVFRALSSIALACVLPVILAVGSCVACFSIVSQNPVSMCCKHRNPCQDKASQSDCLDQAANPGQATPTGSSVTQAAQAIPRLASEPLAPLRPVIAVPIPPGGEASPPGLFVLHSSLLI
jgi:hypothetical protein